MPIQSNNGVITVTGPEITNVYRPLMLRQALRLECKGLRFKGGRMSACAVVKAEYGLRGTRQKVLEQFEALLRERGILKEV